LPAPTLIHRPATGPTLLSAAQYYSFQYTYCYTYRKRHGNSRFNKRSGADITSRVNATGLYKELATLPTTSKRNHAVFLPHPLPCLLLISPHLKLIFIQGFKLLLLQVGISIMHKRNWEKIKI